MATNGTTSIYYNPTTKVSTSIGGSAVSVNSYANKIDYSSFVKNAAETGSGTLDAYMLINNVYDLQYIGTNSTTLGGVYALGKDIDASGTATWNGGAGFVPLGNPTIHFTGSFNGTGHTISGLTIKSSASYIGMFSISDGNIRNLGLVAADVQGTTYVSGLVGYKTGGTITNCFTTGTVTGAASVGGLVGSNYAGSITNSFSTSTVKGTSNVGGLIGTGESSDNTIENCYSTGPVTGTSNVGGLVGSKPWGTITNSYWDVDTSGQALGVGSGSTAGTIGLYSSASSLSDPAKKSAYAASSYSGWDMATTGGSTSVWRIYDGYSYPLLRSFLTPLAVTANNVTQTYTKTAYSGSPGVTYSTSPSGLLLGTVSYGGSAIGAVNAGSYAITPSGLYSTDNRGYDITFTSGTLTINQAPLTVTATTNTKTYDGTTSALATPTITSGTLFTGDTAVFTESYDNKNVGTGKTLAPTAVISDGNSGNNYAVTYVNSTGAINKASLTVTANNAIKTYDGLTYGGDNGVTYSGFAAGENASVLGGTLSFGGTSQGARNAGTYTLTVAGLTSGNYDIAYAGGTLTVNTAPLTVTANNAIKTYDGLNYSGGNGVTYSGFVAGENASVLGGTLSYGGTSQGARNAGTYTLTASGLTSGNYDIAYAGGTLTVNQAPLTVTATSTTKTYDGTTSALATPNITSGTLFTGDMVSLSESYDNKNVGTGKTLTPTAVISDGNSGNNYAVTYVNSTGAINKAALTVTANNAVKTSGQPNPAFTASYSGLATGDSSASLTGSLTFDTTATTSSGPGTYAITLTGTLASPNYTISYADGVLTITGRATNPAYDSAIIPAEQTSLFRGALSSYVSGAGGAYVPLTILGSGINTSGYNAWTGLSAFSSIDHEANKGEITL